MIFIADFIPRGTSGPAWATQHISNRTGAPSQWQPLFWDQFCHQQKPGIIGCSAVMITKRCVAMFFAHHGIARCHPMGFLDFWPIFFNMVNMGMTTPWIPGEHGPWTWISMAQWHNVAMFIQWEVLTCAGDCLKIVPKTHLVGGFNWKMMDFVSWDDKIPNWMESHNIPWFQSPPTSDY